MTIDHSPSESDYRDADPYADCRPLPNDELKSLKWEIEAAQKKVDYLQKQHNKLTGQKHIWFK